VAAYYGQWEEADSKANSLADWSRIILDKQATLGSSLKEGYKDEFSHVFFLLVNYVWSRTSDKLTASNFNQWMFLNGWVNEREALLLKEIELSGDTALKGLFEAYHLYCLQLSNHYELTRDELAKRGIDIFKEEEVIERLESDISSRMVSFNRINSVYNFNDIREQLRPDEIYADVLVVPYFDFENHTWTDSSFYMAYVVTRDNHNAPLLINLGDGKQIDEVLYPYLVGQTTNATAATMDGQVYDLLWKPLEEHLAGKTKIYLSPGGIYHSINPETIYHSETGKYLFEEKEIHLVNSGRSFVDQRIYGNRSYTDKSALIMGAPNFDYSYVADSTLIEDNTSFTYQTMRDLSLDGNRRAAPLPATRSEVEGINQTLTSTAWNTQLLTGNDALEMNLKQMDSPRILHIATHGYFMEDVKPENDNGMRMMGMDAQRVAENPMLRSGLLLAGCNKTLADNTTLKGGDNGILTAYEAGLLDLSKTELVVLSACETGKGEILNGEGVQGLRKAMTDAGAEHILMSLWKVDDRVTSEYMQTFYGHYAQGKSIRESYNLTRNEIKQKYPQPYYWGAFVLVGE
jgi:CHAT domain-containing protein